MTCPHCAWDTDEPNPPMISAEPLCERHKQLQGMAAKVKAAKPKDQRSAALEFMQNLSKLPEAGT